MILLFNAETPGAFLRHQVGGQGLQGGGLSPWTSCRKKSPHPVRHPELGLHYVSGSVPITFSPLQSPSVPFGPLQSLQSPSAASQLQLLSASLSPEAQAAGSLLFFWQAASPDWPLQTGQLSPSLTGQLQSEAANTA